MTGVELRKVKPAGAAADSPQTPGVRPPAGTVKARIAALTAKKWVTHVIRAVGRFNERLGTSFAAAITYFSFLALIPILMLSFSVSGFILSSHPDLLNGLREGISKQIPGASGGLSDTIGKVLDKAVSARLSVGIVGLVVALYSGIGWMGNVRSAVQAQWRPDFDADQEMAKDSFLKNLLRNLGSLAGLGLAIVVSLSLTASGAWAQKLVLGWLGLDDVAILKPVFTIVPILLAMAADVLIFMWVYTILPPRDMKGTRKALVRGSIIAAVAFEILKFALTFLLPKLTTSATAQVFGSIIGLLLFFNLTATMVLFVAAWISTADGGPQSKAAGSAISPESGESVDAAPAVRLDEGIWKPKVTGLLGVGALLGWGWARRRR